MSHQRLLECSALEVYFAALWWRYFTVRMFVCA